MNRVFKTKWSAAHQQYVVTDEHHATKGKSSKSAVALAVSALMLAAGSASAAYMGAGFLTQDSSAESVQAAVASWQTAEYKKDWGLEAMGAANAYALGFNGRSVTVGVMDSGALLQKHPDLAGDRFSATHVKGEYSTTGNRYPQGALELFEGNYKAGDKKVVVGLAGANADDLLAIYNGDNARAAVAGKFTANNGATAFAGLTADNVVSDSLFFEFDSHALAGGTLTVKMKKADTTFESFAKTENQRHIATAIAASGNDLTANILAATNGDSVTAVYSALDDDFYATARNGLVMNSTAVSQAVMDQARGMGEGRSAEIDNGRARIWAAGIGHWGEADGTKSTMDVDFRTGFLGAEAIVVDNTKVGAFFGYGTSDYKSGLSKIDADDIHFGIYGLTDIADATITYGVAYTDEDRDTKRALNGAGTAHSEKASVLQGFVEGAYNFDLSVAKISPYVGFTWAHVKADGATDVAMGQQFKTADIKDDIQIATLGVRTSMPFMMGTMPVAVKADLGWSHYFGDTEAVANVQMGADGQFAKIEGNELKDQFNVGLGITGQVAKHATVGVSYSGAWGNDIKTHGIFANVRFNF